MTDDEHDRWLRDHQRKLVRLLDRSQPPPSGTERVHALLVRRADPAGQVDISDHDPAQLAGVPTPDDVRAALAALIEHRAIVVLLDPNARNPGIAPWLVTCPDCGLLLQSLHRRALELDFEEHLTTTHGYRGKGAQLDLTTPTRGTRH